MPVRSVSSQFNKDEEGTPENSRGQNLVREPLRIGLVNNMPEAAFKATEKQFRFLLHAASHGIPIDLSFYVLRGAPMDAVGQSYAANHYAFADELYDQSLDGLIVTGTEPTSASLSDEPYWKSFQELHDWASANTRSTIWSCLAAHAAVLHRDGIERRRAQTKHFGIFRCEQLSDHWLLKGVDSSMSVPHSRWNGIAENDLVEHGYGVLTRTSNAEVDTFIRQEKSLFLFFQGHPEYETDTLLREYRRDIGRYLTKVTEEYPQLPQEYFNRAAETAFRSLQARAPRLHRDPLLDEIATIMKTIRINNSWQSTAIHLYSNWIEYCCANKDATLPLDVNVSRIARP